MRTTLIALILTLVGLSASAQKADPLTEIPRLETGAGFEYIHANAPPGGCQCFSLSGGWASGAYHLSHHLAIAAEFTRSHASNIGPLGQNLTLFTYTAGPRVTLQRRRWHANGQFLIGRAHGSDSYFPTGSTYSTTASSFAWSAGGGLDYDLTDHFAVRAVEAQILKSYLPNGSTNTQSHLALSTGLVFKLHGR